MDKKQLYIVMIVSVVFLLGIIGYRWIFGDKKDASEKKKPSVSTPAAGSTSPAAGKTVVKTKRPTPAKARPSATGPALVAQKGISDADLDVKGVTDLTVLRTRFGWALDRRKKGPAKRLLDRAVSLAAKDAQLVELGRLACENGFETSANRALARLIAPDPLKSHYRAYVNGLCALKGEKPNAAGPHFRVALIRAKSDVHRARALTQLCRVAVNHKQLAAARASCKGALDKGGDRRAMYQAARLELLGNDKSPKAVTLLERALRLDRLQADVAADLSDLQVRLGLTVKAAQTLSGTATALAKAGRHNGALAQFQKVVKLTPNSAKAHLGVARALRALGKDEAAIKEYRRAGDLAKGDVSLRVELASLVQKKSVLEAVGVLEDALQIDPASQPVKEALVRVRGLLSMSQPKRYRQRITRVEGKLLRLNFTTWGGTPRDVILKKKRYRELAKGVSKKGRKGKEQQVNLVRTWHPYWYPLRLDFDGSTFLPPFPRRHPRRDWQYQSWDRLRWDGKQFVLHRGKGAHVVRRRGKQVFGYRWPVIYPGMAPAQVVIERIYEVDPDKSYAWNMEIRVVNRSAKKQTVKMKLLVPSVDAEKEKRSFFNPVSLKKEAVCMVGDDVFMRTLSSIRGTDKGCMGCDASTCACRRTPAKSNTFTGKVRWIGIDEMYFLIAVAMNEKRDLVCRLSDDDHPSAKGNLKVKPVLMSAAVFPDESLPHKGSIATWRFTVYSGPKISEELSKVRVVGTDGKVVKVKLEESIDYGLFWFIGQPMIWMMKQIQKVVGNWGIAIILLTILIKLLTAPLTMKQMRSMKGMADLKPEIDKLKEKCGDDKQRFQQEMWALYKSHKINPLGGCLPMVLQMPIYIAWYQALMVSVDLYRAPLFGWITDLTKPDAVHILGYPVPILPLLMGATMFLQQRMTPTTADNPQAKMMMYMMPAMFTFFMLFLPSGLTLYILTNTVLTMVHQWYMNHSD